MPRTRPTTSESSGVSSSPLASPRTPSVPNSRAHVCGQRLLYCGALRAFFRPYFLRSVARASRVRKPARLSGGRSSASTSISARAMARRSAPAWPDVPPPCRFAKMSNRSVFSTVTSGSRIELLVQLVREVGLQALAVQGELAGAGHQADPDHGLLAAADRLHGAVGEDGGDLGGVPDLGLVVVGRRRRASSASASTAASSTASIASLADSGVVTGCPSSGYSVLVGSVGPVLTARPG